MPTGVKRLKKRADFLRVAAVRRNWAATGMVLQAAAQNETAVEDSMRVGFTATKKVGNAVKRNRIKRRLRAVASEILPEHAQPGWDYVLIGRKNTLDRSYIELKSDLQRALIKVAQKNGRTKQQAIRQGA
jgi:ribonuclease P protein component